MLLSELHLDLPNRNYLLKNDLAIYAVIAANKWNRPICFTSTQELNDLGLSKYVRLAGLSYRLVPTTGHTVDNEAAYKTIMEKFAYGNADKPGVYYDEEKPSPSEHDQVSSCTIGHKPYTGRKKILPARYWNISTRMSKNLIFHMA